MKKMKDILCVEAYWWRNNSASVAAQLETLRLIEGINYTHYRCKSVRELEILLSMKRGTPGILYFAMHGKPGKLNFKSGGQAPLEDLADMMDGNFKDWHVHLSNCNILNVTDKRYYDFKQKTGASVVSGYTKEVDWVEGIAMDMLVFSRATDYIRPKYMIKYMYSHYPDLIEETGLYME